MTDAQKRALLASAKGIGSPARLVLLALTTFLGESERCWPSNETLCGLVDLKVRSVQEALKELKERGLVKIEVSVDGRRVISVAAQIPAGDADSRVSQLIRREGDIEGDNYNAEEVEFSKKLQKSERDAKPSLSVVPLSQTPSHSDSSPRTGMRSHVAPVIEAAEKMDELGKTDKDWERLFDELMIIQGRSQFYLGNPSLPPYLRTALEQLKESSRNSKWWPSQAEMKAVRWRYARGDEHPVRGCLGGHRLKTGAAGFVKEFYAVASECMTEWLFVHGVKQTPLFDQARAEDREAFMEKPLEQWTGEEIRLAVAWKRLTLAEATAEFDRRNKF